MVEKSGSASFPYGADASELDTALPLEEVCRIEAGGKHDQELEILAALGGKLLRWYTQSLRLGQDLGCYRNCGQIDLQRDSGPRGEMPGVTAKAIAQVDHRASAMAGEPAPCCDPRLGMREAC